MSCLVSRDIPLCGQPDPVVTGISPAHEESPVTAKKLRHGEVWAYTVQCRLGETQVGHSGHLSPPPGKPMSQYTLSNNTEGGVFLWGTDSQPDLEQ